MTLVRCPCGASIPKVAARCSACGRERSHRDCYPEQYQHPLVGRRVRVSGLTGVVERVVGHRFGPLAILTGGTTGYLVTDCIPTEE